MTYLYELSPTDIFVGFQTMKEAIKTLKGYNYSPEIEELVTKAKYLFTKYTSWEGDSSEILLSALPTCDSEPYLMVLIKQINNGNCYLMSPVELPYLDEMCDYKHIIEFTDSKKVL